MTLAVMILLGGGACQRGREGLPEVSSPEYREAVKAFFTGTAALQAGDQVAPAIYLKTATQVAPGEPAGWANLGLASLRNTRLDEAAQQLAKARELAPESSHIEGLLGILESRRGRLTEAIAHYRRAVELDPGNLRAAYALAEEIERQGGPESEAEAQKQIEAILQKQPRNLKAQIELARLAAKRGDAATLQRVVAQLAERSASWPAAARQSLRELQTTSAGSDTRQAAVRVSFLQRLLLPLPESRQSIAALKSPPETVGEPIERFLRLPNPLPTPAAPDMALAYATEPIGGESPCALAMAAILLPELNHDVAQGYGFVPVQEQPPAVLLANGRTVQVNFQGGKSLTLPFPGGPAAASPSAYGMTPLDWNYDFRSDLALAGAGGLKLLQQTKDAVFADVTARAKLPDAVAKAPLHGVWAADTEMDGDLDLILAPVSGPPLVLRNNADGTFTPQRPFKEVQEVVEFCWGDLDADGDPDAAMRDAEGRLHVFTNERSGQFLPRSVPEGIGPIASITIADINNDFLLDVVALKADGAVTRLSAKDDGTAWETAEITRWQNPSAALSGGKARLFVADLDNNGGLDLLASAPNGSQVWLCDEKGAFQPLAAGPGLNVFAILDMTNDGRLDLVGLSPEGRPVRAVSQGAKRYHWQVLRPRAVVVKESRESPSGRRINSFGIGGEMEMRAGLLAQKQPIVGPTVHFGLGDYPAIDFVRIIWPNGAPQAEIPAPENNQLRSNQAQIAKQRLIGSCPWLFTWNGREMVFVTDFLWRSPLGLKINAQDTAGIAATEDWVKIRGDQLAPREGHYDVRITAELWETHFFDHVSLLVVDHPEGTEVFVDERFVFPPLALKVHATGPLQPIARAVDDNGTDVTEIVRARDARYLDTFGRGLYQGVTRDHYVEIELGEEAPRTGPLWLVAHGWIHPTDSSINVAIGQGRHAPPQGLRLEVPDGRGGWIVAKPNLGFPSGKTKTVLIDLSGLFENPKIPRRLRLRTNLEVFWDSIHWAVGRPDAPLKMRRLEANTAELRYRGFSVVNQANESSPELPDYSRMQAVGPQWRDLIGFHTRFGDVRELLCAVSDRQKCDDRYVIMNAGDELALRFAAPPPPPPGWARDFVLIGDGWVKDGNYNTTFSKTVLPLPTHERTDYATPPGRLEDDPVYRRHRKDWETYHTRYVSPEGFHYALRP